MLLLMSAFAFAQEISDDAVALFNQGQELHEKGDLAGAIKLYDKALEALSEFPEAEFQRAAALQSLGRLDEAEKGYRRAIELRPDWSLALTNLGSLLVQENKFTEAETILSKTLETDPQNSSALVSLADLKLRTKASAAALQEILTKITALTTKANPTAALWSARGVLENALGKRDVARTSLAKALALNSKDRNALFLLADIAVVDGDLERAKSIAADLEKAGAAKDDVTLLRANIFANEGKPDEALKQLDLISKPNDSVTQLRSRLIASTATNIAEIEKQLAADEKNATLLGRLCTLYRKDDPAKALDYCRRASEAEPTTLAHAIGYGAALVQAKQFAAAVNLFRKLIEFAPGNWTAHANLATALFKMDRWAEAKAEFLWLTEKQPKNAAAFYFLGIAHDRLGEYLDASATYQQYLKLADPDENKLEIESVTYRLPLLQKLIKEGKGKKSE